MTAVSPELRRAWRGRFLRPTMMQIARAYYQDSPPPPAQSDAACRLLLPHLVGLLC
jgi:hypothetical protein